MPTNKLNDHERVIRMISGDFTRLTGKRLTSAERDMVTYIVCCHTLSDWASLASVITSVMAEREYSSTCGSDSDPDARTSQEVASFNRLMAQKAIEKLEQVHSLNKN